MLRLSRLTDYGILLLTHMARDAQRTHAARELAAEVDLPLPTVSKVLKTLTRTGLLVSHRGVVGGYELARPASAIAMTDIVAALEGPIALTLCSRGPGHCELEAGCSLRSNLEIMNKAVVDALAGISLAALARPLPMPFLVLKSRRVPS